MRVRRPWTDGTTEPLAVMLRPGSAGSNTAADHITVVRDAPTGPPSPDGDPTRTPNDDPHRLRRLHAQASQLERRPAAVELVRVRPTDDFAQALLGISKQARTPAADTDGRVRDGAWVADVTVLRDLSRWLAGMRGIARKEGPTPAPSCASPTSTGRVTALATNNTRGRLAGLELRHRQRACAEDRPTGCKNPPRTPPATARPPPPAALYPIRAQDQRPTKRPVLAPVFQ